MIRKNKHKLLIFIPAFIACIIDLIVTVINQPTNYWLNNLKSVNEANPLLNYFMKHSILGIFVVTFIWLILIAFTVLFTPINISKLICLSIIIGNSWGASTWIIKYYGFNFVIALFIINAGLFIFFDEQMRKVVINNSQ